MNHSNSLIEQMLEPNFYPHQVMGKIELMQTHASFIFLTGKYAYKVKKNINLGFLDYSTKEKRQYFIETELRLNQKIAPELYLEVVPISTHQQKFILGNCENIVEYALKMRQFPQANLFSNLLAANQLSEKRLRELGRVVAQFHNNTASSDYVSSFGTAAKISAAFTENYRQSQKYIGSLQTQGQFEATKAYTDSFFGQRQELFVARVQQGKIKECHGDLHLNNICLWQDKIQLFDRIEFNESFRFVDTMYDVAFTVMDLEARGKPKLANAFLNSYLEHTGDWIGLSILPLYLSRQAYVRAKVASFLTDDPQVEEVERQTAQKNARNYYQQAYRYSQQRLGSLILMSGLSGSGKSTVARVIARNLGGIQIRSDAVRKHLAGIALEKMGTNEIYTPEMTQKTYDRLIKLGIVLAKAGYTVILDAKYDRRAWRQAMIAQAQAQNISLKIVHCTAPISVLRDRLNQRQDDISDAGANLIELQQANAEEFTTAEQAYVATVDTSQLNWQNQINQIFSETSDL